MAKRGPRPKLDAVARLDGTRIRGGGYQRRVLGLGGPFMPEHIANDAKACIEIIQQSMPPGVYAKMDTFLLAAFATAWAVHKQASTEMARPDFVWMVERITGPADNERVHLEPNAWIKVSQNQAMLMASLGDRLGLDPKSRAAIQPLQESKKQASKFDGLVSARMPAEPAQIESSGSLNA